MRFEPSQSLFALRGVVLALVLCSPILLPTLFPGTARTAVAEETVVIVLEDGTELSGVLVRETDTEVAIRSTFGVTTIDRVKIKEIRRGANPWEKEFDERWARAERAKEAACFLELAEWAREKGLTDGAERAFEEVIALEPDHEAARLGLGHARHEGSWVDADRVAELEREGYVLQGVDLVKKDATPAGSGSSDSGEGTKVGSTPVPTDADLSPEEIARREKAAAKRREKQQEFEEDKRREYEGVPWVEAHRIKTPNYEIICNSTLEVARTYQFIMEALYATLSKRFKQKHLRRGRMPIFIYKTHEEFMTRTGMPRGVGGFYSPPSEQVHAYHGTFGLTGTTYSVLAHEGTHQFQGRVLPNMGNMNNWIIEGFAVYFGDGSRLDYKKKKIVTGIIPRDRLFHIQDKMREGTYTKLSELAGLPRRRFGGSHYADSWAILYYLLNGPEKKKGQMMVSQYWLLGCEQRIGQREFDILAEQYFGSVSELDDAYKEFILSLVPEPAGEVEDGAFVSLDFMFEIEKPGPTWKYDLEKLENSELVKMTEGERPGEIVVRILQKADDRQNARDYIESVVLPALEKKYTDVSHEQTTIHGLDFYRLEYSDPAPVEEGEADAEDGEKKEGDTTAAPEGEEGGPTPDGPEGSGGNDGEKDGEKGEAEEVEPRHRYRDYVLVGVSNAYSIRGKFELEEFESRLAAFERCAQSFQRILRNRW